MSGGGRSCKGGRGGDPAYRWTDELWVEEGTLFLLSREDKSKEGCRL